MPRCSSCGGNTFIPRVTVNFPGLHDKLRTEYGPASVRPDELASVLQNIQKDLEDCEAEIHHLERLRQEKQRLEQYAAQMRSLFSPIRKVPDEIICHIFDDCCDMNSFQVIDLMHRPHTAIISRDLNRKPTIVISSVCSRWRRNALSMPVIWSRISLHWKRNAYRDYGEDEHAGVFFLLSLFLRRSQQHSLTVHLKIEEYPILKQGVLHPLTQLFAQMEYIPQGFNYLQLSHLDFLPGPDDIQKSFDRCPNLFSLRVAELWQSNDDTADAVMYATSSRLEILTNNEVISGRSWDNFEPFMAFVRQSSFHLTTFSIQQLIISNANLVDVLVHLPTLQNLTVDDSGISPKYSPISSEFIESLHGYRASSLRPSNAIIIPRLRSLRLLNVTATVFSDQLVVDMVQSRWIPTRLNDVGTSTLEVDCLRAFTMTFLNRSEAEADGVYTSLAPIERHGMMIVVQMLG
ncbi:hypothetical protein BDP27DRAFT_1411851 [Rhodocollybia butyracea]|uniref:F-box domain-containing protein n=1 Tax=Rhodocollybia butyracea TaxID=206335 RepID=A0A9P5P489_9AGAR|nr:hypothetical protein BDP27DRAFT_1411851 [Rhodocollybia butyracea]